MNFVLTVFDFIRLPHNEAQIALYQRYPIHRLFARERDRVDRYCVGRGVVGDLQVRAREPNVRYIFEVGCLLKV